MKKYVVVFQDNKTKIISVVEIVEVPEWYTIEDYVNDWKSGDVSDNELAYIQHLEKDGTLKFVEFKED